MTRAGRTCALGAAALLIGLALPASADTAVKQLQLAQASDSGTQSGTNARQQGGSSGTNARGTTTTQGGSANMGRSEGQRTEGRSESSESRTSVRANVRGGDREMRGRRFGSRTTIRTRVGQRDNDDVIVRRKHRRHFVSSEPSTRIIKRKRLHRRFVEGGESVVHRRRGGASVGIESRTSVRERGSERANVRGSMTTRATSEHTSTGTNVRTNTRQGGSNGAMQSRGTSGRSGTSGQSGGESGGTSGTRQ